MGEEQEEGKGAKQVEIVWDITQLFAKKIHENVSPSVIMGTKLNPSNANLYLTILFVKSGFSYLLLAHVFYHLRQHIYRLSLPLVGAHF